MRYSQLLVVPVCGLVFFSASRAEAGWKLGADANANFPINANGSSTGFGGALRFGYELHLPLIAITPEVGLGYDSFGGDIGSHIFRGFAGGRLGIGEGIRPGVYAHIGFGSAGVNSSPPGFSIPSYTGSLLDAGVFLDFTLLPIFDIGAHAGYNVLSGSGGDAAKWVNAGVHISFSF